MCGYIMENFLNRETKEIPDLNLSPEDSPISEYQKPV
jgi:hypothetical protein